MKPVLVTGSAGFIGFHVAKALLEQGIPVVGVDNFSTYYSVSLKQNRNNLLKKYSDYVFLKGDITQEKFIRDLFANYTFEKICHLAAQAGVRFSLEEPYLYEKTNILGTVHLLENARKNAVQQFVYASSSSVYGNEAMPDSGFSEEQKLEKPISVYAATKLSVEHFAHVYHALYGIRTIGLRFFTVYGPWGRPDMAYFEFTKRLFANEIIQLNNNGDMYRDFTYIDDIVLGVLSALNSSLQCEVINLGNSQPEKLQRFLTLLERYTESTASLVSQPIPPGDMEKTFANISKAERLLHWKPKTHIDLGLKNFVDWYKLQYPSNV